MHASFAFGFDLTAASYSANKFRNLNPAGEDWQVAAVPTFSTINGMEGVLFSGLASQSIMGEMRALYEASIVCIAMPSTAGVQPMFGGTLSNNNSFRVETYAKKFQAAATTSSGYTTAFDATRANVFAASFSPFSQSIYAQVNNGPLKTGAVLNAGAAVTYPDAAIGRHRLTYYTGWIGRVLVFSRALHFRDPAAMQAIIAAEMQKAGL